MQTLDISQINILAPYPVWYEGEEILIKTDYNILYSVAFELKDEIKLWRDASYRPSSCIFLKELPFRLHRKSGNIAKKSSTCTVEITQYALTFPRVPWARCFCPSENSNRTTRRNCHLPSVQHNSLCKKVLSTSHIGSYIFRKLKTYRSKNMT